MTTHFTVQSLYEGRDMGIPVSFADVEQREFEPMKAGRYPSKVTACDYVPESANSGEPYIAWQFTVQGGDYDGRIGFLNTSLQKQSLWATMRVLLALGFTEEELRSKDWDFESEEVRDQFLEREGVIVVRHQMFEGTKRQRVTRVLPMTADAKVPF